MSIRCEDFSAALASGGLIRRWRATRHASRCPRCASARVEVRRVAEALADVTPLTVGQRSLWIGVAGEDDRPRVWCFRPALAGALATGLLVGVGLWWAFRPVDLRVGPTIVEIVDPLPVRDVESLPGVADFVRELEDLRRQADLLDARKDLDTLLARLVPRGDSRGL